MNDAPRKSKDVINAEQFIDRLGQLVASTPAQSRVLVALAGPPAAGKTTLADRAIATLNTTRPGCAALLPMDGYHYDDEFLEPRGWRPRKGAPHTFDVEGLHTMLNRLRLNDAPMIAAPRFDRDLEIARAGAIAIEQSVRLVLIEGLYLLLDDQPWAKLASLFDISVMIKISESEIAHRLQQRWIHYKLDEQGIREKLEENDLPNGRLVYARSRTADWTVENG